MLKQFELTSIGTVAPEAEDLFVLEKEKQSLVERIFGRINIFRRTHVDAVSPDRFQGANDTFSNGVTRLY